MMFVKPADQMILHEFLLAGKNGADKVARKKAKHFEGV